MSKIIDNILNGTLDELEFDFRKKVRTKTKTVADWQSVEHAYSSGVFDSIMTTRICMAWVEFKVQGRGLTDAQPAWAKEKLKWTPNLFLISLQPKAHSAHVYQVTSDPAIKGMLLLIADVPLSKKPDGWLQLVQAIEDKSLKFQQV